MQFGDWNRQETLAPFTSCQPAGSMAKGEQQEMIFFR
jgi:hypothetical protein